MVVPVSGSMAGLGECVAWADDGSCIDDTDWTTTWDPYGSGGGTLPSGFTLPDGVPAPNPAAFDTGSVYATAGSMPRGARVIGVYQTIDGTIVTSYDDGSHTAVSASGHASRSTGSLPPAGNGVPITGSQANAWAALINSLTRAGVQLGSAALLQPGQSLLPNGTIVGVNQSGGSINSQLTSILTNPMFLIAGGGILLLAIGLGGRR